MWFQKVLTFVGDHWLPIAFVTSELLALLPGKWNGIAQAILNGLGKLVSKKE